MSEEERRQNPEEEQSDLPASVIFMEMMRRQAAKTAEPEPSSNSSYSSAETNRVDPEAVVEEPPRSALADGDTPLETQRIRRVKKRQARRRNRTLGTLGGMVRTFLVVIIAAGLMATIFTWWTSPGFLNHQVRTDLQVALATSQVTVQPTGLPTPNWLRRVGIVSGHHGPQNDPGAVCPDGLMERTINENTAQLVVKNLRSHGYSVDLLDEFDPRLNNYQAAALVSIHANTCKDWGERVSGFLVAQASARPEGGDDQRLAECIAKYYGQATHLERRFNLTVDMTDYHTFREIHPLTPAAIIEQGFMLADRDLLEHHNDTLAGGITQGILCFLEPTNPADVSIAPPDTPTPETGSASG